MAELYYWPICFIYQTYNIYLAKNNKITSKQMFIKNWPPVIVGLTIFGI